ncbi:MAG: DUF2852 domain-containing protein [Hyphomicrobium sp.]|uniref:DUF2852 domain-containing protein n=1 Tax=Hyphomicrobium sp. TaxID=82 RepID=UPI0039E4AC54
MAQVVQTLDEFGRPAWLAAMVLGFIVFWPVGAIILAYMLWSGRMNCGRHGGWGRERWEARMAERFDRARSRMEEKFGSFNRGGYSSGNKAFDDYREATLKRLEEEEREFRAFLDRLRQAKDKSEFDQFMSERRDRPEPDQAATT